jgi:hypothetical protein
MSCHVRHCRLIDQVSGDRCTALMNTDTGKQKGQKDKSYEQEHSKSREKKVRLRVTRRNMQGKGGEGVRLRIKLGGTQGEEK